MQRVVPGRGLRPRSARLGRVRLAGAATAGAALAAASPDSANQTCGTATYLPTTFKKSEILQENLQILVKTRQLFFLHVIFTTSTELLTYTVDISTHYKSSVLVEHVPSCLSSA